MITVLDAHCRDRTPGMVQDCYSTCMLQGRGAIFHTDSVAQPEYSISHKYWWLLCGTAVSNVLYYNISL